MAYAPTTWDANDVITKDKLNKIEQGINTASKLSGTDIDTDKDWGGKNISNMKSLTLTEAAPAGLLVIYPSETVIASSPGAKTIPGTWTVLKSATVSQNGVVRVRWTNNIGAVASRTRVVIGSRVFGEEENPLEQTTIRTIDVPVGLGDTISVEGIQTSGIGSGSVSNFQILGSLGCIPYSTRTPTATIALD